ncbi:OLC1v1030623C1 [Oldenlandia corymbosa var. corymbosa]|uniref:OLC1v1030623C1 n=1 Tax=Oldenlandia corymbosa var. corymbosa TaxID=529605 RepID=A0AAV1CID0_OLDCO|nr:OLC1v1030623C1 [Oldenlandia corymbosa var. corymbosa]
MPSLTCNSCNKEFEDESEQKLHYKSEWHRYNLKRKVAGVPGVTEALFLARQTALAEEKKSINETPTLYSCGLCGKDYRSAKAHAQHIKSKNHVLRASQGTGDDGDAIPIVRTLAPRVVNETHEDTHQDGEESEETDWEEVDPEDYPVTEATDEDDSMDVDDGNEDAKRHIDPSCCFMCDLKHDTIESCMVHMHKQHGFFIPDVEYLKDPKGLLTYLGLKVVTLTIFAFIFTL